MNLLEQIDNITFDGQAPMNETIENIRNLNRDSVDISDQWLNQLRYVRINRKLDPEQEQNQVPEIVFVSIPDLSMIHEAHPLPTKPKFFAKKENRTPGSEIAAQAVPSEQRPASFFEIEGAADEILQLSKTIIDIQGIAEKANQTVAEESEELTAKHDVSEKPTPPPLSGQQEFDAKSPVNESESAIATNNGQESASQQQVGKFHLANVEKNLEIEQLVDRIHTSFPVSPVVLMFVGTEDHPRCDSVCAKVAGSIAARDLGRVLLVDANIRRPRLTTHESLNEQKGLTDFLGSEHAMALEVKSHPGSNLDFLARGLSNYSMIESDSKVIAETVNRFKQKYRFTFFNVGHYCDIAAKQWGKMCDATYLVLSLNETDQVTAIDATEMLHRTGSRLCGAIATKQAA